MARPKLGEGETQRLQLKISDEELTAIDDWRFENRVPSRSEAVRRLAQMALILERNRAELNDALMKNGKAEQQYGKDFSRWISSISPQGPESEALHKRFLKSLITNSKSRVRMTLILTSILRPINILRGSTDKLEDALDQAKDAHRFFQDEAAKFLEDEKDEK